MTTLDARPGCDTSDMLTIHALFRRAFADAPGLVRGVADGDAERARIVGSHVREVAGALHTHHSGEDELLWDTLEQRAPACALHVGLMRAQHQQTAVLLDALLADLPAWESSGAATDAAPVADTLDALGDLLQAHLGQEEADILPTAATVMTQREWGALHEHGMASIPRDRMLLQLGWILEVVAPDERAGWMRTNLPAPARVMWRIVGRRQFAAHRARVYGA
ncbi:hemerythrin domain-containing protein [Cellulomonas sp. JH27-2]|uniref:hemerythrin domain-containing protein n=1 Tax=Cellulomonas sp. JH27-2 TaxID=2774139 RepID=UPI00178447B9|nr:hemerythrin domain-containing protein [Cellulomonas sp. JH27-2]MBD8059704.1 hemerythrin domain-containing protein [Cellulomonas sp. JH27-2]